MRFQSIPTSGDYALYPYIICGHTYIAAINHYDGEKNVERRSTTSDMCTSPLDTTFNYHIPRNFYPSGDSSMAVKTSDFPNRLYLLLQRNRKQIQDKEEVVEVDLKKKKHTTDPISTQL